jgi:hypothetical protein
MADDPHRLDPEELALRYPTTYRPLGRFKDKPKYFRRKKETAKEKSALRLTLRKQLKRRGIPESWDVLLLHLKLKPAKLLQRLRDLEFLQSEFTEIKHRSKDIRSRIKSLLRKSHEPIDHQPQQLPTPAPATPDFPNPP